MGTVDPPDTVAGLSPESIRESMERSDGKIPDGVTRLPYSYASAEVLSLKGICHVDVTDGQGGVTDSFPIEVVRYVEIRGFQVWEAETRDWGYVGYFDDEGVQRFRSGFIRTTALPHLDDEAADRLLEDVKNAEPTYPQGTFAQQILDTITSRGSDYGPPSVNHQLTADLWSSWLSRKTGKSLSLSAEDVCILNILQKLSRLGERSKDDTCLDVMGFMENVSMLLPEQRNHGGELGSTGAGVS